MPKNDVIRGIDIPTETATFTGAGGTGGTGGGMELHDLFGPWHEGLLPWASLDLTGSSLADLATRAHSALTGVGPNDHHAQSHVLATTSGLGGDHSVSGLTAGYVLRASGLTTAAFAAIQDADLPSTIVRTSRTINSGAGLTGGGPLSADLTLNVGQGDGITVNANDVALATSVAGAGLFFSAAGILAVGAGAGLAVNANDVALTTPGSVTVATANSASGSHTHAVVSSSNPGGAAALLASDGSGYLTLVRLILSDRLVTSLIESASGNLELDAPGDIVLDPAGQNVLPGSTITDDMGAYSNKWRTLYAAELYVETLVAQYVMATIGGRVMVAPTTTLIADITAGSSSLDVKHNNLHGASGGKYIYLSSAPGGVAQVEVMQTSGAPSAITGGYRYTVTRNLDGSGANAWTAGDAVVSLGRDAGEGYIDLTSTSTIHSHAGPTMTTYARTGSGSWNSVVPTTAQGNLDGFVDYAATEFGFAFGNDLTLTPTTGFKGGTLDRTNGVRLFNVDLELYDSGTLVTELNNVDGLKFRSGDFASRKITWWNSGGTRLSQIAMISDTLLYAGLTTPAGQTAAIEINAQGGSGVDNANLYLYSAAVSPEAVLKVGAHTIHLNTVSGPRYGISGTYYKIWHENNDGASSGLDADLLDGYQASGLMRLDSNNTISRASPLQILNSTSSNQNTELRWTDNGTTKGSLLYAGANSSPNKYFGFSSSAEYLALFSDVIRMQTAGGAAQLIYLSSAGLGIGLSSAATDALDINGTGVRVRTARTPASASAAGNQGTICWDSSYIYVCTATNTWKRAAIATW